MKTLRNVLGVCLVAAFALMPLNEASARVHHRYMRHHMAAATASSYSRSPGYMTRSAYVPSTNRYDNGHANVINKTREKWANAKRTTRYETYRLSHGGNIPASERAQDARREAQDRAHEAQDRARMGR